MKQFLQNALNNWKTTSTGVGMIAGAIIHLVFKIKSHAADENTWTIAIGAILGGIGLIAAGDAKAGAPPAP